MTTLEVHQTASLRCSCGKPATTVVGDEYASQWTAELWCGRLPTPEATAEGRAIVADLIDIADRLDDIGHRMDALDREVSEHLGCNLGEHNDAAGQLLAHQVVAVIQNTATDIIGGIAEDDLPLDAAREFIGEDDR